MLTATYMSAETNPVCLIVTRSYPAIGRAAGVMRDNRLARSTLLSTVSESNPGKINFRGYYGFTPTMKKHTKRCRMS